MPLEWKDAYKIGNAEIDAQHQEWFRLGRELTNATDKGEVRACVTAYYKYTKKHFMHEEGLMKRLAYPELNNHNVQHLELIHMLNDVAKGIADESLELHGLEIFLSTWLIGHIGTFDKRLANYVAFTTSEMSFE